jgi:hypothetical protein
MRSRLVYHKKEVYEDESILEIKIWQVPESKKFPFGYKYSFVYIQNGVRAIGYDNAEGKGEHRHFYDRVAPYSFTGLDQLLAEFLADVQNVSGLTFDRYRKLKG